jgi:hypothetical protein
MDNTKFLKNLISLKENPISCKFLLNSKCLIGWYGGNPTEKNCHFCIASERNNENAKAASDLLLEKSHPSDKPRISGCCDSAKNYID